jgi:hypothetical protein
MSEFKKVFVRPDNTVVLKCPHCEHQREVDVSFFRGKRKLSIKCCKSFKVQIESRQMVRKHTRLLGTYIHDSHKNGKANNIVIHDITLNGVSFSCLDFPYSPGDKLTIEFTLEDEYQTLIKKDIIIRNIRGNIVGCEFVKNEELTIYDAPLGYYVVHALP